MKTVVVLTVAIFAQAAGNLFLSSGMKQIASSSQIASGVSFLIFVRGIESPTIWIWTGLSLLFFLLFVAALSWADLSFFLPASSFGYVLNVAFAHYFLNEPVSRTRWLGTVLISLGVLLVSKSGTRTLDTGHDLCDPSVKRV